MEKMIKIKIDDKGRAKGTVGWLLDVADHIKIGTTKSGNQGAWLKDVNGETITVLAIRNWEYKTGIQLIEKCDDMNISHIFLCPDFPLSDACYERLYELAQKAAVIMDELWEENFEENINVETIY